MLQWHSNRLCILNIPLSNRHSIYCSTYRKYIRYKFKPKSTLEGSVSIFPYLSDRRYSEAPSLGDSSVRKALKPSVTAIYACLVPLKFEFTLSGEATYCVISASDSLPSLKRTIVSIPSFRDYFSSDITDRANAAIMEFSPLGYILPKLPN